MTGDDYNLNLNDVTERLEVLRTSLEALRRDISEYIDQKQGDNTTHYYFDRQLLGILGEVATVQNDVLASETHIGLMYELINISARLSSSLDLDYVVEEILDTVLHLTGGERAILFLTHAEGHKVELQAARDWEQRNLAKDNLSISNSVVQDVVATRQAVITTDVQKDLRIQKTDSIVMNELRSIIALPLIVRAHLIGILYLDSRISYGVFNEENFPILNAFATQAAIAIENAHQFAQIHTYLQQTHHELLRMSVEINEESVAKRVEEITTSPLFSKLQSFRSNPTDKT